MKKRTLALALALVLALLPVTVFADVTATFGKDTIVPGETGVATTSSLYLAIQLTGGVFTTDTSLTGPEAVEGWFHNKPAGLKVDGSPVAAQSGNTVIEIYLSGTPLVPSSEPISVTIPRAAIVGGTGDVSVVPVTSAVWAITGDPVVIKPIGVKPIAAVNVEPSPAVAAPVADAPGAEAYFPPKTADAAPLALALAALSLAACALLILRRES